MDIRVINILLKIVIIICCHLMGRYGLPDLIGNRCDEILWSKIEFGIDREFNLFCLSVVYITPFWCVNGVRLFFGDEIFPMLVGFDMVDTICLALLFFTIEYVRVLKSEKGEGKKWFFEVLHYLSLILFLI